MADRRNSDNNNTQTIIIPPEAREYYPPPQYPQYDQYGNPYPQGGQYGEPYPQYEQYGDPYYPQVDQYGNPYPPPRRPDPNRRRKKRKKKKRKSFLSGFIARLILILMIVFLIIFGLYSCGSLAMIRKMNYVPTGARTRSGQVLTKSYVTNILLLGTDGRTSSDRGRSDTMLLLSINSATDEITLTSFMRDCYVEIPGYGWDKLNASYSYGGAELCMDTIEHNFGIRLDNYISVNFVSFANIVDSVGGIDIDLSDAEAREINTILEAEVNEIMGDDKFADMLSGGGTNIHLNGKQALSYARIRYVGNADFERTERQRRVLELVMDNAKTKAPSAMANISSSVMPSVNTNMTTAELYLLSLRAPFLLGNDHKQLQIPAEGTYYGDMIDGSSVLVVDLNANYEVLKNNMYSNK